MTRKRLDEIKKIAACVPYLDADCPDGVAETQRAFRDLINERTTLADQARHNAIAVGVLFVFLLIVATAHLWWRLA